MNAGWGILYIIISSWMVWSRSAGHEDFDDRLVHLRRDSDIFFVFTWRGLSGGNRFERGGANSRFVMELPQRKQPRFESNRPWKQISFGGISIVSALVWSGGVSKVRQGFSAPSYRRILLALYSKSPGMSSATWAATTTSGPGTREILKCNICNRGAVMIQ